MLRKPVQSTSSQKSGLVLSILGAVGVLFVLGGILYLHDRQTSKILEGLDRAEFEKIDRYFKSRPDSAPLSEGQKKLLSEMRKCAAIRLDESQTDIVKHTCFTCKGKGVMFMAKDLDVKCPCCEGTGKH